MMNPNGCAVNSEPNEIMFQVSVYHSNKLIDTD